MQAANAQGKTILSHLHRNSRCKERVLIIGEMSMCSLSLWAQLAEASFVGCLFVVIGDEHQCPPIGSDLKRWKQLPDSDFMHNLTNGLCVQLRRFWRRQLDEITGLYVVADLTHLVCR